MKALWSLLAVLVLAVSPGAAFATPGETVMYGGGGQGRIVFDGKVHAAKGFDCNDCHLSLFTTQKQSRITMADHFSGAACFACHTGQAAFNNCGGCHRKIPGGPQSVTLADAVSPVALEQPARTEPKNPPVRAMLTYEGASTIGTKILPEASKLFTQRTGVPFGAIGGAGAGAGLKAVVEDKVSFGGLASEITDKEKAQVTTYQVIGYDVMGVFVHPNNPVKSLTMVQLKEIFSGRAASWKQFGGPDLPITVYSEKLTGGRATVKAFKDMVLGSEEYGPVKELDDATDCIEDVGKDESGITASSMSFATPQVAVVAVNQAQPARESVQSGAYPLKRPLTLISKQTSGDVKAFFDFMLTKEAQDIVSKNFVPVK